MSENLQFCSFPVWCCILIVCYGVTINLLSNAGVSTVAVCCMFGVSQQ